MGFVALLMSCLRPGPLDASRSKKSLAVTNVAPGLILIFPKEPPSPEYVLGDSSLAITGYDFGFHSAK
jgi:hypothetical protein